MIETVLVPEGAFTMGDPAGRPDEQPTRTVSLSAFHIALSPVTNRDYAEFLAATGHDQPRFWDDRSFNRPNQPAVGMSWHSAVAYGGWLSAAHDRLFRLPTEAEWEKAARGGHRTRYPWGDDPWGEEGGRFKQEATWEIGRGPVNPIGLVDIGFNIHEWCSDWYDPTYYATSPESDPQGPPEGQRKSSRGGAWRHLMKTCRSAARSSIPPDYRYNDYGFRLALDPD